MSLPRPLRTPPAMSLNVGVLLAMAIILSLSFLAFHMIADHVQKIEFYPTFDKFDELQLQSARTALLHRGQAGLKDYLTSLNGIFGGAHYLLDANGIDPMLTGVDRSALLPPPPLGPTPHPRAWPMEGGASIARPSVLVCGRRATWPPAYLDVSPLLIPRHRRHGRSVLARVCRRGVANSPHRQHHRAVRAR